MLLIDFDYPGDPHVDFKLFFGDDNTGLESLFVYDLESDPLDIENMVFAFLKTYLLSFIGDLYFLLKF